MNNVSISGRLVYEPEIKYTTSRASKLSSRIAVQRTDKNRTTDFLDIQAWNKTAEFIVKYFKKGDPIEITGKLQTQKYTKQDGTEFEGVYIYVTEVNFTLSKKSEAPAQQREPEPTDADAPVEVPDVLAAANDLPFQI